jgi:hypothetical protein
MRIPPVAMVSLLSILPWAPGCGGSSSAPVVVVVDSTLNLVALPAFDSFIPVPSPGSVQTGTNAIAGGDEPDNSSDRFYMSFDLSGLPAGATVVSATLTAQQVTVFLTPYADLGNLLLELVDLGPALDVPDFGTPPIPSRPGNLILSTSAVLEAKIADVAPEIAAARAAALTRLDLRARFQMASDGNNDADIVHFGSVEGGAAATLAIVYH